MKNLQEGKRSTKAIRAVSLFYRPDNEAAKNWDRKIRRWLQERHPAVSIGDRKPQAVVVLGGDGAILEAVHRSRETGALIVGLNLGTVGFLSSVRAPEAFLPALDRFFRGDCRITERGMLQATAVRGKRTARSVQALNEIAILNPVGMVEIEVRIAGHPFQYIRGSGALVATATGSTAYNLSAHGPIVMPDLRAFILSELLDHNIPTPSVVLKDDQEVSLEIRHFRKRGELTVTASKEQVDVLLLADGEVVMPLAEKDTVIVRRSPFVTRFVEFEDNYFLKSLQEKFSFR